MNRNAEALRTPREDAETKGRQASSLVDSPDLPSPGEN
jgi:hypothetical protein